MRQVIGLACAAALAGVVARGEAPELGALLRPQAGAAERWAPAYAYPSVVDWNNDGRPDVVVGHCEGGYVRLYLNRGTTTQPRFDAGARVLAGSDAVEIAVQTAFR
jgi:hypothetical protein